MEHNRPNSRQNLSVPQTVTSSSPSSQLRHRPSFRDRFWKRTSANYDGEDDVVHEPQASPIKKSPYVPMNAASGFSRTAATPREQFKRRSRTDERPSSRESAINVHARSPLGDLAAGHLYVHAESEPDTTDFAAFIAAAQTEERVRRAASQRQGARSHYRDSGYYSSSNGGRHDHEPYSPSLPSSASAAGAARLKAQSSRTFGQRLAEYVKPPRDDSVPSVRR
ncbi:uncharacterized protein Triagg1_3183 [Trichoderma aggressivum f. europaeum]|uniref:Uncharacterized protein n=1 Tax=Trichoderma aggressivum f. europaeum TaxID=173218 RepID=A0AAE1IHP7_9HYPO|nr:hypothetical protein Triagg1_3183 [Trichoderma aggressivum f. europaeum]